MYTLTNEQRLDAEIALHGTLDACPWTSMFTGDMTLGEMTDKHLMNCLQYHEGLRMMAEVTPGMEQEYQAADYIVFKMRKLKESRN